jgi:hypothetical protein
VQILKASGWADNIQSSLVVDPNQSGVIMWDWNRMVSHFMQGKVNNALSVTGNVVTHIYVSTSVSLGDLWLTMGTPSKYGLQTVDNRTSRAEDMVYRQFYGDYGLGVTGRVVCSYSARLWETPITVYFTQPDDHTFLAVTVQDALFRRRVLDLDNHMCEN